MALSEIDRHLLERCLSRAPRSWEDFVDRFMGLVVHLVNHSAQARSMRLSPEDRDDLCGEFFLAVIKDDFAVLRRFRGQSSLATYLTVVARRVVVRQLMQRKGPSQLGALETAATAESESEERLLEEREEVHRLLDQLSESEAQVVRLYYLDGKSYREISEQTGMPENTLGSILSRARDKLRQHELGANPTGPLPS